MRLSPTVVAAACCVLAAATPLIRGPATAVDPHSRPSLSPASTEPAATVVLPGDVAPDVSWEAIGSRTLRLRDLRAHGHVLLLFSPTEAQLRALERDRDRLLSLRVVPAAVLDRSAAGAASLARRLALQFTVIPDPEGVIADQFNALDPATRRMAPAWFVVDHTGKVRALDRTRVPDGGFVPLASAALALPAPDAALPGSTR